ncbi:4-hydroxy-tetrahydrodipicolinate reductase [Acidithiobacillus sulfurivorans]|uniref:4-hydroxy-tetrahydrodipicolinate reductase n=1 Tax=Acidithiobacillus sulfurivorans TaxID=1958756 RepID=A0ABS5ZV53_9PROT|nr:4-hydroxy-tetrahydrodipicolinate reductase [Acidithiobacillus sulfurivorans]MBU2758901.1 4-hydroxy-tetrahydrodipicolinate reductase [Acidithiobacillus sulfurivorans]
MNLLPTRVAITAVSGRMGRALIQALEGRDDLQLTAAIGRAGAEYLTQDAGRLAGVRPLDVPVTADLRAVLAQDKAVDVVIEFGPVAAALDHVVACQNTNTPIVIGTTGFSSGQQNMLKTASRDIPLLLAPNMSVGINVLLAYLPAITKALGESYDVEIVEAHHRHKVDAPSGTALALGRAVAKGRGVDLKDVECLDRNTIRGPRQEGSIGFATLRAADVVGEHTVWLAGAGERLELTHRASSRLNFAEGALRAARWLAAQSPGFYDMQDVLGLKQGPVWSATKS